MVETGLRTSEACNLLPENILLKGGIPHVRIAPKNRVLRTKESAREIPLVGCALMAMQADPGGFPRYIDKEARAKTAYGALGQFPRYQQSGPRRSGQPTRRRLKHRAPVGYAERFRCRHKLKCAGSLRRK
jgi:integrase